MLFSGIAESLRRLGYGTSVDETLIPDDAKAILLRRDFLVAVRQRDISDMCYSLAHELGHILDPFNSMKAVSEIKADMFACSLLLMFGVDKSVESKEYVRGWSAHEVARGSWVAKVEPRMKEKAKHEAARIWEYIGA